MKDRYDKKFQQRQNYDKFPRKTRKEVKISFCVMENSCFFIPRRGEIGR